MKTTLIFCIVLVVVLIMWLKDRKELKAEWKQATDGLLDKIDALKKQMNTVELPDSIYGIDEAYEYPSVELIPLPGLDAEELVRKEINFTFINEQAVAWIANKPIGAVGQRGIAYMIRDWIANGDPIYSVFLNSDELTIAICFYKKGVKKKKESLSVNVSLNDDEDEDEE